MRGPKAALAAGALILIGLNGMLPGQETASESKLYIVHFTTGPAWKQDRPFAEQEGANEHSRNMQRLRREGKILFGARYADKGMVILRVASEKEAREEIERDPAMSSGVFRYEIAELHPFYEGCVGL